MFCACNWQCVGVDIGSTADVGAQLPFEPIVNGVVDAIIGSNMGMGIEFLLGPHNPHSVRFGQLLNTAVYAFVDVCISVCDSH